jgi:predicted site-specific integrase-resolvase
MRCAANPPFHNSRIMNQNWSIEIRRLFRCINQVHKDLMIYGYARVSTDGQSVEAQVRQLTKAGCKKVFRETASGVKIDRTQLRKTLDQSTLATC